MFSRSTIVMMMPRRPGIFHVYAHYFQNGFSRFLRVRIVCLSDPWLKRNWYFALQYACSFALQFMRQLLVFRVLTGIRGEVHASLRYGTQPIHEELARLGDSAKQIFLYGPKTVLSAMDNNR